MPPEIWCDRSTMKFAEDEAGKLDLYYILIDLWEQANSEYLAALRLCQQRQPMTTSAAYHIIRCWWLLVLLETSRMGHIVSLAIPANFSAFLAQIPVEIKELIPKKCLPDWQENLRNCYEAVTIWRRPQMSTLAIAQDTAQKQLAALQRLFKPLRRRIDRQFKKDFFATAIKNWEALAALSITVSFGAYLLMSLLLGSFFPGSWGWVSTRDFKVKNNAIYWNKFGINRASDGSALSIGGEIFKNGFGTHAVSQTTLRFRKDFSFFSGACGVDDSGGRGIKKKGSVECQIKAGGVVLFSSDILRGGDRAVRFRVPVKGIKELTLIVTNGGDSNRHDHTNWVDLRAY